MQRILAAIRREDGGAPLPVADDVTELQQQTLDRVARAKAELEQLRREAEIARRMEALQVQADVLGRHPFLRERGSGREGWGWNGSDEPYRHMD